MNFYKPYRLLELQQRRDILAPACKAGATAAKELIVGAPIARLLERCATAQQGAAASRAGVGT
jgi:hypothetical protein